MSGIVVPKMYKGGNLTAQTANPGTGWTAFAAQEAKQLTLVNNTGTTIEFRQDVAGVVTPGGASVPVFDQASFPIFGIADAAQIYVRRVDTTNTQVTVAARWEA